MFSLLFVVLLVRAQKTSGPTFGKWTLVGASRTDPVAPLYGIYAYLAPDVVHEDNYGSYNYWAVLM